MPKPEIIGSARSTYTWAVRMVCEEKGIDYVLTETPLRAPELLAIHPFGKMPVLRHGDVELFESKAIATYLDRSFPAPWLFPSDPRLAGLTEQWVSLVNTVIDRTLIRTYVLAYIAPKTSDGTPDREAIDAVMPAVREQLAVLDRAVALIVGVIRWISIKPQELAHIQRNGVTRAAPVGTTPTIQHNRVLTNRSHRSRIMTH